MHRQCTSSQPVICVQVTFSGCLWCLLLTKPTWDNDDAMHGIHWGGSSDRLGYTVYMRCCRTRPSSMCVADQWMCPVLVALVAQESCASFRAVENLTDATLALTPPLIPSTRWQLPSDDWFEQRDAAQRNVARRNTLWRLSSRLFQRVFSLSRSGNQLAGQPNDKFLHFQELQKSRMPQQPIHITDI